MMNILLITNQQDLTTDFIVRKLRERGLPFYRLNTEEIGRSLTVNFDFASRQYTILEKQTGTIVDLMKIKSVYYRRPEINDHFAELTEGERSFIRSELVYTLEGLYRILDHAAWLNHVIHIRNAENKIYQLLLAQKLGFQIPQSLITNCPQQAWVFYNNHHEQCIIKPIKSGLVTGSKEEGVIFTNKMTLKDKHEERISLCPVYLQPLIDKRADIRVTIVGDRVFAARIHSQVSSEASIDWRRASHPLVHSQMTLSTDLEQKCIALVRSLHLQYGAIDFIEDKCGKFIFLEINPNGQWAWIENRLNLKISDAIAELLAKGLVSV